jgi:hypothetical protein
VRAPAVAAACLVLCGCTSGALPLRPVATQRPSPAVSEAPRPSPATPPALDPLTFYSGAAPSLAGFDPAQLRLMVVTGDVIPARETGHVLRVRDNWNYAFDATRSLLRTGDITFANLESPLLSSCPDIVTGFTFCADARFAAAMQAAGVTMVNVANNHSTNQGQQALTGTVTLLQAHGMGVTGFGRVAVQTVRDLRFGFVGINLVGTHLDAAAMQRDIAAARAQSDVVVVQFHWGREYETYPFPAPSIAPDDPKQVGRLAVDDGADIVIGNHPHCVQGTEMYHGHLITYAHGNFIFDQHWSTGTQEGVVGRYWFYGRTLVAVQYTPVRIYDDSQPRPLDPAAGEGRAVLDRMLRSTRELEGMSAPIVDGPGIDDACP